MTGVTASEAQRHTMVDVFPQLAVEMEKVKQAILDRETKKDEDDTENHGGTLNVESSSNKGAKFIIRLPIKH
ncbi:hypothetical protein [Candidatus Parabeggiatoa sp. HSG14]|uniref:hypothetical protein n=1 Tax=Candidatus Parabeggiatoa sp. HSG14 TaxID=3055593 RepID=UPI0025A8D0E1|nr:hypothetical protein [Thiotrichales bacterium HSG14]